MNNGRHPEFTLPRRIEVVVPFPLVSGTDLSIRMIDSKGIDRTAARADLEAHPTTPTPWQCSARPSTTRRARKGVSCLSGHVRQACVAVDSCRSPCLASEWRSTSGEGRRVRLRWSRPRKGTS